MKKRWFDPSHHRPHQRIAILGLVVGTALEMGCAVFGLLVDDPLVTTRLALGVASETDLLSLSAGYAGTVLSLVNSGRLQS